MTLSADHQLVLGALTAQGTATSPQLQVLTGKSQPTVSRLLNDLGTQVLVIGRGRATRYALGKSIHGRPPQHPLWWTDESGRRTQIGTLTYLANDTVYVQSPALGDYSGAELPWYLSPLRAEGFLGRVAARSMSSLGVESDPARWSLETVLYAALHVHDAPGAMTLGVQDDGVPAIRLGAAKLAQNLDEAAAAVASTLPAGSSAGGEQPKFLAYEPGRGHVIVKFSPPARSPGGKRWGDLLCAEHVAGATLLDHGIAAARSRIERTERRTYLISDRFDRLGAQGRRHVVPIGKAHEAFVHGAFRNWAETGFALASRGSLTAREAEDAQMILNFGRLIGNTDMHSGNLGLFASLEGLRRGRFELAPVYDMLPMRWRPDPLSGTISDYTPYEPDAGAAQSAASPIARSFWERMAQYEIVSPQLREVAQEMAQRLQDLEADQENTGDLPTPHG